MELTEKTEACGFRVEGIGFMVDLHELHKGSITYPGFYEASKKVC